MKNRKGELFAKFYQVVFRKANAPGRQSFAAVAGRSSYERRRRKHG